MNDKEYHGEECDMVVTWDDLVSLMDTGTIEDKIELFENPDASETDRRKVMDRHADENACWKLLKRFEKKFGKSHLLSIRANKCVRCEYDGVCLIGGYDKADIKICMNCGHVEKEEF